MGLILSEDQEKAIKRIHQFFEFGEQFLSMGGYAGVGKTTVLAKAISTLPDRPRIAFVTLAGKAASVLKKKLMHVGALQPEDYCGTIHGLIYKSEKVKQTGVLDVKVAPTDLVAKRQPFEKRTNQEIDWVQKDSGFYDAIVIDEASMVNREICEDLDGLNIPILAVGDHGQLGPISKDKEDDFNLMRDPMIRLERIHRQAEGDPIIQMSIAARESGRIPIARHSDLVEKIQMTNDRSFSSRFTPDTMVLCGQNPTRVWWNNHLRGQFGFTSHDPMVGERIICLNNNYLKEIYNGETGIITGIKDYGAHWYIITAEMDSGVTYNGKVLKHQFGSVNNIYRFTENGKVLNFFERGDLFDWAYCITTWKAQGSEWDDVVVLEERQSRMDEDNWRRFLYTGVTRSRKKLLIIGS